MSQMEKDLSKVEESARKIQVYCTDKQFGHITWLEAVVHEMNEIAKIYCSCTGQIMVIK